MGQLSWVSYSIEEEGGGWFGFFFFGGGYFVGLSSGVIV